MDEPALTVDDERLGMVIGAMRGRWQLHRNNTEHARHYLQEGGMRTGGRSRRVGAKSVARLEELGLIEKQVTWQKMVTQWALTEKGFEAGGPWKDKAE